jgi:hypothetical protein
MMVPAQRCGTVLLFKISKVRRVGERGGGVVEG